MDKLSKVIEKRSSARAGITKLVKRLQTFNYEAETTDSLSELLEVLEIKEKILKGYDVEVEELITDSEKFKTEITAAEEYDEKILMVKIKLKNKIKERNREQKRDHVSHDTSSVSEHNFTALKLPKLEIPRFSGDSNFMEFLNCFDSAIGSNDSLTKIEKFQYLKSLLSPPAYNVVAGFELNEKNYDSCLELLKQRYGRTDCIINSYMTKLLNLEPVRNSSYVKGLRKLYDEIEINIRNLRALNVTEGSYGHLLNPLLLKLLPQDLVLEFHRKRNKEVNCEVSEIMTFLRNEVESREISESVMSSPKGCENKRTSFQNYQSGQMYQRNFKPKNIPTASALITQVKKVCVFCELNSHDSVSCRKLDVEQKISKLKSEGRCWACFARKHISSSCRSGIVCKKCLSKYHHESVCRKNYKTLNTTVDRNKQNSKNSRDLNSNETESERATSVSEIISSVSQCNENETCTKNVYLQTCTVIARSENKYRLTRLMFDCGSSRSFISEKLANDLKLKTIRSEILSVYSFGTKCPKNKLYRVVELILENTNSHYRKTLQLYVTEAITGAAVRFPDKKIKEFMIQQKLQLADESFSFSKDSSVVDILLGSDICWELIYAERISINKHLSAINSAFGWIITGTEDIGSNCSENIVIANNAILNDLRIFWEIEEFPNETKNLSEKDNQLIRNFENSLKFNGDRYVCKLMWKENIGSLLGLDSNYEVARRRFNSLKYKLNKNPEILDQYKQIVSDQLKCDIVRKCVDEDLNSGYYMPHRAVIRDDKDTSRVRIVFDCSSKANENTNSLNDLLESGVNLYPNLLDILLKFRENQVAFCGDIEKAFLMIEIAEEDRKYLKFLWFPDEPDNSTSTLQLNRLPFGLTTSPFALACVLKFHIKKFKDNYPNCYEMLNSLYVDDLYYGAKTAQDAYKLTSSAIEILRSAGFNLRKLKTNCIELNKLWDENGYGENMDFGQSEGFLGLKWDPIEDRIKLDLRDVRDSLESGITKRHVLRTISKIFDPCGLISPFVIRVKILMQELWERGLKWDENLPNDLEKNWRTWYSELDDLDNLNIERKLFTEEDVSEVSLHIFSDASPKAYGAVAFVRYLTNDGKIKTSFVISKSKVAPLKTLTLAKLELMAALVGARLGKYIRDIFPVFDQNIYFWSDSQIVLHWVKSSSKIWKPFVANRVAQIQSLSLPECWNFCSGSENPADLTTRGELAKKILLSSLWWKGPAWLSQPPHLWPGQNFIKPTEIFTEEMKSKELRTVAVNTVCLSKPNDSLFKIIEINNYSNLSRLLRVTAWIKRFVHNANPGTQNLRGPLCASELQEVLNSWIKVIQLQYYASEIQQLISQGTINKNSTIYNLNCGLDENNFLCLQGRLQFTSIDEQTKHPLLLPSNDKFVELLILDAHVKMGHLGVDATLTHLRERFWILKGRQFVKKVLKNCLICRKFNVKAGTQVVAPLPPDRIQEHPPFDISGVDFAGPFFINDSKAKCYLLIFTCAVTRAVHLELVTNMSTDSFLLGFRRFISRRGLCSVLYSDNAKAFKRANYELKKWWNQMNSPEVLNLFALKGIEWKFIVERSPWWGGFWERQIRTIKTCLKKIIGKTSLSLKELDTVFIEIEAIINSRPITYLYNEPAEPSPLTPSHFLVGKRLMSLPVTKHNKDDLIVNRHSLVKRYRYQQTLLTQFWNRWRKEYLLNLRSAYVSPQPGKISSFKVNDVVLVNDERYSRNMWMMGRILELYPGRDGKIRSLLIKTPKGDIKRSIQLVYNLEINP